MLLRDRLDQIVRRHLPPGYTLSIHPKMKADGTAWGLDTKAIHLRCPVNTPGRLQVFLHEVVHVLLYHVDEEPSVPDHVSEYEAERLSLEWADLEGFGPSPSTYLAAAHNVVHAAKRDKRAGITLEARVLWWAWEIARGQNTKRGRRVAAVALKLIDGLL